MGPLGLLCASLFLLLTLSVRGQEACFGHGQLVDGKCVCTTPLPVDAAPGWVGDECRVPVHRIFLNAQDVQETCGEGHVCNVVAPNEPVCFATAISEMADAAFHLTFYLASNSVDAAVSLRGLLTNFSTVVVDPATNTTKTVPQAYPTRGAALSFSIHTTHESQSAQLQLTRRQLGYGAYTGLYLCAESTASTTIALRGATHTCPFTLQPNGALLLCSGRGTTDACPHGTCACQAPYAPPANWVVTPGLGFEECRATLQPLQPTASPPAPASLPVAAQAPGAWSFFSIDIPVSGAFELRVTAAATEATKGVLALYLRHLQLPGEEEGHHDAASDATGGPGGAASAAASSSWWRDLTAHVAVRRSGPAFRPGTWYLGVYNKGVGPVTYGLTAALHECPNNCSGRGACNAATATCTCSQPSSLGPDCSVSSYELALGQPLTAEPRASFAFDRLTLRGVRSQLRSAATSRLALTASFTTSDADPPGLPVWVVARPVVMVAPSAEAAANATAGGGGPLWPDGVAARMALTNRGAQYSMDVGPWMVSEADDSLHVVVWNPLSGPSRLVGYTLAVAVVGSCLADCSGHGTCDNATGLCTCQPPFAGGDCSVDLSQYNTTGGAGACAPGSLRPVRREEAHATCWQACKPDGSGYDESGCAEFTCDGPGGGHGQLRRRGGELACVEDACVAGNYTVADASGDFTCTRRCACPEDGSACGLEADCLPGTVQCMRGMVFSQATGRCVQPPCQEGSLRKAYELQDGTAFAVCVCAQAGDPASCAFTPPSQADRNARGVVACQPGFERTGSSETTRLSDGSTVTTGGLCERHSGGPRRGVSGGMVFFYCLLSIALAAGLVVGGKYGLLWYEQYRYGRSAFSHVSWPLLGNRGTVGGGVDDW